MAGRSGGAHEAVDDGETGYVVAPRAVAEVRAAVRRLCADAGLRQQMGRAARVRAETDYTYEHLVDRLLPITRADFSGLSVLPR